MGECFRFITTAFLQPSCLIYKDFLEFSEKFPKCIPKLFLSQQLGNELRKFLGNFLEIFVNYSTVTNLAVLILDIRPVISFELLYMCRSYMLTVVLP